MSSNILLLDIETSPITGYTWGAYDTDVLHVLEPAKIICAAWKWLEAPEVFCKAISDYDGYKAGELEDGALVNELWSVLDKADIVVAHNGDSFDIKRINSRFIFHGLRAPSPYRTVDTLKVAKKYFRFDNNTLDQLGAYLKEGRKEATGGLGLWLKCIAGDADAWARMKKYNKGDIVLLEKIYLRLRPFIVNHPDVANGDKFSSPTFCCPTCGSSSTTKRGHSTTLTGKKQRYQCNDCGSWSVGPLQRVVKNGT